MPVETGMVPDGRPDWRTLERSSNCHMEYSPVSSGAEVWQSSDGSDCVQCVRLLFLTRTANIISEHVSDRLIVIQSTTKGLFFVLLCLPAAVVRI